MARAKKTPDNFPQIRLGKSYLLDMSQAFNWYNARWGLEDYKKNLVDNLLSDPKLKPYTEYVRRATHNDVRALSVYYDLLQHGVSLEEKDMLFIQTQLDVIKEKYPVSKAKKPTEPPQSAKTSTDYTPLIRDICGEIDEALDALFDGKSVSPNIGRCVDNEQIRLSVESHLQKIVFELETVISDKQLQDEYNESKRQLQKILKEVENWLNSVVQVKRVKKVVKKVQTPTQQTKKMNVLKSVPELDIVGKSPSILVGAKILFVYYPDARKLVRFVAQANSTLGAHGMSVVGYDVTESKYKTIRNPEKWFKENKDKLTRPEMRKLFETFGGSGSNNIPSRLNNKCIVLC